jgi:hypothetical protein
VLSLAFSGNGRRLASSSSDRTVLVWDLTLEGRPTSAPTKGPGDKEIARWWADLASADAGAGYAALWRLAAAPGAAVPFLRGRLTPVTQAGVEEISQAIVDLGSKVFAVRQRAFERLRGLGRTAAPELRAALRKEAPLEVRRRVEQLLDGLEHGPVAGEWLRSVRALAVLEHAGTPEARQLLRELAGGARGAWLTEEARAAWGRLERRCIALHPGLSSRRCVERRNKARGGEQRNPGLRAAPRHPGRGDTAQPWAACSTAQPRVGGHATQLRAPLHSDATRPSTKRVFGSVL